MRRIPLFLAYLLAALLPVALTPALGRAASIAVASAACVLLTLWAGRRGSRWGEPGPDLLVNFWSEPRNLEGSELAARFLTELLLEVPSAPYACLLLPTVGSGAAEPVLVKRAGAPGFPDWFRAEAGALASLVEPGAGPLLQTFFPSSSAPGEPRAYAVASWPVALVPGAGRSYGSLHLVGDVHKFYLPEAHARKIRAAAAQLAVLLENRSLRVSTRVDPLTRLYNRGYLNDRLREELARSSRTGRPFSFLMLDVDHFKRVNDEYGHPAGDEVLLALAERLRGTGRASDAICRYGGEEIAIVLADTPLKGALVFAENLRRTVNGAPFRLSGGRVVELTVSVGVAEHPGGEQASPEAAEALVRRADEALYAAKRAGRDRTEPSA